MPNPIVHFEIHAPHAAAAQEFYRQLFGWHVDTNNPMSYGMVDTHSESKGIGGGITANPMKTAMVTVYVDVNDLQATLDKAEQLGGKTIMPPTQVYEGLTIALFTDPDGNAIGLAQGM